MTRTITSLPSRARHDERGAALIQVGIAIFVLVAMTAFVLDFGVMWMARRQAQNAADAGALAGAIARLYDETGDSPAADGLAHDSAVAAATANEVFNEAGGVRVTWECPPYVDPDAHCVRVDVHRDGTDLDGDTTNDSNPLPVFFASLFGRTSQNIKATATAWLGAANAAECLKPFAVPDLFPVDHPEQYTFPGYNLDSHEGTIHMLKGGADTQLAPGWFRLMDLVGGAQGGAGGTQGTRNQVRACIPEIHQVNDVLPDQNGNQASVRQALEDLYNLDPGAYWDAGDSDMDGDYGEIMNSCADNGSCRKYVWDTNGNSTVPDPDRAWSPRVMALPLFDPKVFAETGQIKIVNIMGFFLLNDASHPLPDPPEFRVWGVIVNQPGLLIGGVGDVPDDAAFLKVVQLIR